jgi:hypothetical protein
MLGYTDGCLQAYHVLNVDTGRIVVRENCIFDISLDYQDVDEIEVARDADRDDISEFEILIEDDKDSTLEDSDEDSVVSGSTVTNSLLDDNSSDVNSLQDRQEVDSIMQEEYSDYWNAPFENMEERYGICIQRYNSIAG